MTLQLTATECH